MLLEFTYSKDEYVDGWRKFIFLSKAFNKIDMVIMICSIFIPIYLFYHYGFTKIYVILACVIYSLDLLLITLYLLMPMKYYQEFEKYHHPYKLLFEDDKITFDAHAVHSTMTWDIYKHYKENMNYFYLIQKKRSYTLIPKRVFTSEEEISAFRQLLTSHLTTP